MENLLFSVNTVFPLFIVMLVGVFFRRIGMLDEGAVSKLNLIVFRAALPAMIFTEISSVRLGEAFDLQFIAFISVITIIIFSTIWLLSDVFIKDKSIIGAFVQGSFRGNYALLGLPLIKVVLGDEVSAKASVITAFLVMLYNILSVIVLVFRSKDSAGSEKGDVQKAFLNILTNPLIITIVFSVMLSVFQIRLPVILTRAISYFSNMSSPLALLTIGASITFANVKKRLFYSSVATLIKLVIAPSVTIPLALLAGFNGAHVVMAFIIFGVPTAVGSFSMAKTMESDSALAANIVVQTTLFSILTLTLGIFIFKSAGMIL